jgi:diketogulonate reductase-like aldo/keto reductase
MTKKTECTILNNGIKMPWLGLGVFLAQDGKEVENAVRWALETGYRSIDTAAIYGNEQGVGTAIRQSGITREEIFLTTKVWNNSLRNGKVQRAFEDSLRRLEIDYIDLYLIHWPVEGFFLEAWSDLEKIYQSGRAKAIGVSNFMIPHLKELLDHSQLIPAVNQVEFHPYLVQPDLLKFCRDHQIQVEAWSPLMKGQIFNVSEIIQLTEKYKKSPAQIALRWNLQHQVVTIPKSVKKDRILENSLIFDFELSESDMTLLDSLDCGRRVGPDPFNFYF